jgi:DNA processing protein
MDQVYPEENIPLSRSIVEQGGMLLTEMPLGWQPRAQDFPRRNRLVSGASLGVVVVEAAKRSGSLITARLALEQNREVFAVPGSPLDQRSEGGNHLIQQGARLVTNADDIVEALGHVDPTRSALLEPDWLPDAQFEDAEPTDGDRERLLEALSVTPTSVDALIAATGLSVAAIQTLLLELDIAGRIEWSSGQLVALRP